MRFRIALRKLLRLFMKLMLWIVGILSALSITISLLLLLPSVQNYVVDHSASMLSDRTGMNAKVGSVYLRFPKTVRIGGIEVIDHQGDTLLHCESIAIRSSLFPLMQKKLHVEHLQLKGLSGYVFRDQKDSLFNFQPIAELFTNQARDLEKKEQSDWNIGFDKLELQNIWLRYYDQLDSSRAELRLDQLTLVSNFSDIINQQFDLEKINLAGLRIDLVFGETRSKEYQAESQSSPTTVIPQLQIRHIELEEIAINLSAGGGKFELNASLGDAKLIPKQIDLETQSIELKDLIASEIDTRISMHSKEENPSSTLAVAIIPDTMEAKSIFGEIPWVIQADHTAILQANVKLDLDEKARITEGMDYQHMDYQNLSVDASDLYFDKDRAEVKVNNLEVNEIAGAKVGSLSGEFQIDNSRIKANKLALQTAKSSIQGDLKLSYPGLEHIGNQIENLGIECSIAGVIHLSEMDPFTSARQEFPILKQVEKVKIKSFNTLGTLANLKIKNTEVSPSDSTRLKMNVSIQGLPGPDLHASFRLDTLISTRNDIVSFIPDSLLPSLSQLPPSISVSGTGNTDFKNSQVELNLVSEYGNAKLIVQNKGLVLQASITTDQVHVGKLLDQELLGTATFKSNIHATLHENVPERIEAKVDLAKIEFNDQTYENGIVDLQWQNEKLKLSAEIEDEVINAQLNGTFNGGLEVNHVSFKLNLEHADLKQMNFLDEQFDIQGRASVDLDFESSDDFKGLIQINDTYLEMEDRSFHIDEIRFDSDINSEYTNFQLNSEILDAELTGNTKISELKDALVDHLDLFISLPDSIVNQKDFVFEFNLNLKEPDVLTEFFVQDLEHIELEKCHAKYNDAADFLEVDIIIPELDYSGYKFYNLNFEIESEKDWATAISQFDSLRLGDYIVHNFLLNSDFEPNQSNIQLSIRDVNDSLKYQLAAVLNYEDSIYKVVIDDKKSIINYQYWQLPAENYLVFQDGDFYSRATVLRNGNQEIRLNAENNRLALSFQNLLIENFMHIVDFDSTLHLFSGMLNGTVDIVDPFSSLHINAEVGIDQFAFQEELIGDFMSEINYGQYGPFKFYAVLNNETNYLRLNGSSYANSDQSFLSMILESDISDASSFQSLFSHYVHDLKGALKGRISLSNNSNGHVVSGNMEFSHLGLTINPTNTSIELDGGFNIDDNLLAFEAFFISDSLQNRLNIDGQADFSDLNNPMYNIALKSEEFQLINSPPSLASDLSGNLPLGIDLLIEGPQSNLGVSADFIIKEGTNLMYVMPGKELELITDEGIVRFIDFESEQWEEQVEQESMFVGDSIVSLINGIDLNASITIDPKAQFTAFIDPNSGDLTKFRVEGRLNYKYNEKQQGSLNGLIEFVEGHYDLSFYGLVQKRFDYDAGSTVSWSGEVFDGDIDFSARHTVLTNSVSLVSNEISSGERALYNQRIPYDVILEVSDKINFPRINFKIDLPSRYRAIYPTIDSKLNILNQPSMEAERNKQVFALLVGGTFIPENPNVSEGSANPNFATTAARNTVNAIMTQQLNKLTGQFIQGLNIDMGVNSYDDYASGKAQTQTQLDVKVSKNLFNDRVSAEVESHISLDGSVQEIGQSNAGMTEFAVSYKLTEQGNYRIKAFRENAFDIFDGEIQNSGIAFIFVREFDTFKDWKRANKKPVEMPPGEVENNER